VALFDIVANNADRKGGHCLVDGDGVVWLIDHGVCFAAEPKLRTVIWAFVGEPIPTDAAMDLARLHAVLVSGGPVLVELAALLAPDEVAALDARVERLLAEQHFPEPDPDTRPYPWPPI
jgi:uncharacterized repeat protein (TIGR03843 family)